MTIEETSTTTTIEATSTTTAEPIAESTEEHDLKQPFQIISISEDGTHFVLNEENLSIIVGELKKLETITKKLCIVAVVGAFRTGKSFLLSTFIRYLHHCQDAEKTGTKDAVEDGMEWLTSSGSLTHGNNNGDGSAESEPGFEWQGGKERKTTGMWIYGLPFIKTLPDSNEKAAVLLMDTQGMFDMETSKNLTAAIFGLSTLISSYQIFNVKGQMQENILDELDFFTQLSLSALRGLKTKENYKNPDTHPFQAIEFLMRDYQNFDDPENITECLTHMETYMTEALADSEHNDDGMRDRIKETFEKMHCFCLPHPGNKMSSKKWVGTLEVVDNSFLKLLNVYVRQVFDKNIVAKKIQGRMINGASFENYIKAYVHIFKDGKVPEAKSLVQAISDATNVTAKEEALELYKEEMDKLTKSYLGAEELAKIQNDTLLKITSRYDSIAFLGNPADINKVKASLLEVISQKFTDYKNKNKTRLHANMEKYVIPFMAAIFAYLLDWATDWLCDSWSETCRQISRIMFLVYFLVSLVILFELAKIYKGSGGATASMAALTFGRAAIVKAKEINDDNIQPIIQKMSGKAKTSETSEAKKTN